MFEEFSPVSKKEWLAKIEQDLKGRSPAELDWEPEPGLRVSPFAHPDDLPEPPPPMLKERSGLPWLIGEDFSDELPPETLNTLLLEALNYGLQSPRFVFRQMPAHGQVERILRGVELSYIAPHFFFAEAEEEELSAFAKFLSGLYGKSGRAPASAPGHHAGSISVGSRSMALSGERLAKASQQLPAYRFIRQRIKGTARDGLVEPLRKALHQARETFGESPLKLQDFNRLFLFELETGPDYLLEIARLRALRLLWANLLHQHGLNPSEEQAFLDVHLKLPAPPNNENTGEKDALRELSNHHMIAAAPMALAALSGGADRLSIPPAGAPQRPADSFSRRIARNVQHLLRLESGLDRVADPFAGSWYVENLTRAIAQSVAE